MSSRLIACLCILLTSLSVAGTAVAATIVDLRFPPDRGLPIPGDEGVNKATIDAAPLITAPPWRAPRLAGEVASETREDLLGGKVVAGDSFSVELWLLDHVNHPVGAMLVAETPVAETKGQGRAWALGYRDGSVFFGPYAVPTSEGTGPAILTMPRGYEGEPPPGYKEHWHDLLGTFDGEHWRLYHNGELIGEEEGAAVPWRRLDLAAYLGAEPYMQLGDLVQNVVVYDEALDGEQAAAAFAARTRLIDEGRRTPGFHFTAGPYLNTPDPGEMWLLWETDRPSHSVLEWGERVPYAHRVELTGEQRLHKHRLRGLATDTPYFYRVTAIDENGRRIDSGPLTFRTLPEVGQPLIFAVGGDTEARPFVNAQISRGIWEARPQLLLLTGDLTDGSGPADQRWQWTHEYFVGMTPLTSRIPVLAAPGNGESDLVWFNHYHDLPGPDGYYNRRVGDVEFFALDSNLSVHERREPGFRARQRKWLETVLKASTATWKIALHHHPLYSSDDDDYGDTYSGPSALGDEEVRSDFLDLYERYGVDMVFYSHLHSYERTWPLLNGRIDPRGIVYVQIGGYGGNHERSGPTHAWFDHTVYSGYHYGIVRVHGEILEMTVYDAEQRLRDSFTLSPRHARR